MSRSLSDRSDLTATLSAPKPSAPGSAVGTSAHRRRTNGSCFPAAVVPAAPSHSAASSSPAAEGTASSTRYQPPTSEQGAAANKSGNIGENKVDRLLTKLGYAPQRWMRIVDRRISGDGHVLDNACYLPALSRAVTSLAGPRGPVNVVISVKRQHADGSIRQKLPAEIDDLGDYADRSGLAAAVVLDTPVYSAGYLAELRERALIAGIALLTLDELEAGRLVEVVLTAELDRARVRMSAHQDQLLADHSGMAAAELGWLQRERLRRAVAGAVAEAA